MRSQLILFCVLAALLLATGCQQAPPVAADTHDADVQAIKNTLGDWQKAGNDLDKVVGFYADDASLLPPEAPIASGKEAIKAVWKPILSDKNFALQFEASKVDVAKSGELGWAQGTYSLILSDAKGKAATEKGKFITVFKKQADGNWKALEDMFNSDAPPPK
jgi:ketosteroid isomerase-like protein